MPTQTIGDSQSGEDRGCHHRQRKSGVEQHVAALSVRQQQLDCGGDRERLEQTPGEQEPTGCAAAMSPGDERDDQREQGRAEKQDVAHGVDQALEPDQLCQVGDRQHAERDRKSSEYGIGARREQAYVGDLPDEQARRRPAQGDRHVPGVGGERPRPGKGLPVESLPGQKGDVQRLQREQRGIQHEDLVREDEPDQ